MSEPTATELREEALKREAIAYQLAAENESLVRKLANIRRQNHFTPNIRRALGG